MPTPLSRDLKNSRGNRRNPFLPFAPFNARDPRQSWALVLDLRVHFALNCGAKSCPPIGVYSADKLEEQLELATASYLHTEVEFERNTLLLPTLLKWYSRDFGGKAGIARLLSRHLARGIPELQRLKWRYKKYDWTINQEIEP